MIPAERSDVQQGAIIAEQVNGPAPMNAHGMSNRLWAFEQQPPVWRRHLRLLLQNLPLHFNLIVEILGNRVAPLVQSRPLLNIDLRL